MHNQTSLLAIVSKAFIKMHPVYLAVNPMMLLVFATGCGATTLLLYEIYLGSNNIILYAQMTFWIWMTIFFSTLADSFAASKGKKTQPITKDNDTIRFIKKLSTQKDIKKYKEVELSQIKLGNILLLKGGDIVPCDGIIVRGSCYVNETDVTGELGNKLKSSKEDNILITGSIIEGSDWIVMKVSFSSNKSFATKTARLLEGINRQALPSELALQRIILGLYSKIFRR